MMDDQRDLKISKNRLEALVDGIFAFAMTLLVTGLVIPHFSKTEAEAKLAISIAEMRSEFISFLVAFFVLASFWHMHNRQFHYVRRVDPGVMRITLFILACVVLMPFTTNISGDYSDVQVAVTSSMSTCSALGCSSSFMVVPDEKPGYHICCDQQSRCFKGNVSVPDHTGYLRIGIRPLIYQPIMVDGYIPPYYTLRRYRKEILSVKNLGSSRHLSSNIMRLCDRSLLCSSFFQPHIQSLKILVLMPIYLTASVTASDDESLSR